MTFDVEYKRQKSWQYRCIEATRGNQTMLGAVIIAMLGKQSKHPPRFWTGGATIDKDGNITSQLQKRDGSWHHVSIGTAQDFGTELNRLADTCKLDGVERLKLFEEAQKWVVKDHRATSHLG
jgi:hypothetical protein